MMKRRIGRFLQLPRSARRIRADIDEELRFDIDMRARDLMSQGASPDAARARAVEEFGDLEATRRYCEELDMDTESAIRRAYVLADLRGDVAIAWRGMRRAPAFALVVLATLALGIGANTAVFSVVRRVLIAPLPYRAPNQLFRLYVVPGASDGDVDKLSAVELADLAAQSHSLSGLTQFGNYGGMTYTDGQTAEPWQTVQVALNFFDVMDVHPVLGRSFIEDDIRPGAPRVIMLGHGLWQRVFGGDRNVIGRRVQLNNVDHTIVGVLPATFVGPTFMADGLLPLNVPGILTTGRMSRGRIWRSVARVRDGVSLDAFRSELALLRPRIQAHYPEIKNAGAIRPVALHAAMVGTAGPVLRLVMAGALLVLVITCVNIAGLFLSRAAMRRRELGVRAALGAGRGRLVRQVLTESALYGIAGGIAGVAAAGLMKGALVGVAGTTLPQLGEVRIDAGVLAFAAIVSIACGFGFGLAPAIAATRIDLRDALGDTGGRGASRGRGAVRGSRGLVSAQIAFAVVLVIGAGLIVRTFLTLTRTSQGYNTDERTLTFRVNLPAARYGEKDARSALVNALVERIHAMPGVTAVGFTAVSPWNGGLMNVGFRVDGRPTDENGVPSLQYATASDEFFAAIGIPLRAGRVFTPADRLGAPLAIVISESVARRFWPNGNSIGARVRLGTGAAGDTSEPFEVVGVVGDVRPNVMAEMIPTVYVSERQWVGHGGEFVVRTGGDAAALVPAIKETLHALDAQLPVIRPRTLHDVLSEFVARQHLAMTLMGGFAALSLILAALGVYTIMAYAVLGRSREFGIRSALGARRSSIVLLVLRQGFATTAVGIVCGVLIAALASRYVASLLVGVSTHDALTFVSAAALLAVVGIIACLLPARAATRVQPVEALRLE